MHYRSTLKCKIKQFFKVYVGTHKKIQIPRVDPGILNTQGYAGNNSEFTQSNPGLPCTSMLLEYKNNPQKIP